MSGRGFALRRHCLRPAIGRGPHLSCGCGCWGQQFPYLPSCYSSTSYNLRYPSRGMAHVMGPDFSNQFVGQHMTESKAPRALCSLWILSIYKIGGTFLISCFLLRTGGSEGKAILRRPTSRHRTRAASASGVRHRRPSLLFSLPACIQVWRSSRELRLPLVSGFGASGVGASLESGELLGAGLNHVQAPMLLAYCSAVRGCMVARS